MPVVAQINVNFANLQEVRNVDEFDIASGGDFQIEDKCINPNILTKYCLYNREYGDAGDYGLSDVDYLRYIGGYISAGNKVNVKHSDLHVRNNLHVGDNLYAEYIYSRFYNKTDGDYQDERAKNPRFITLSPKIEDKFTTYLTIETRDANTRFIDLHAQRSTTPNKIRIDSNATTDKIEVISPIVNLFKDGATNGVVNINSFLNVANDTKINTNKFVVTASDGKTQIAGNLNVGSDTSYSKFTVESSTGNTVVEGTLAVTGNTTLKNNVIFEGGSSQTFVINNGTTGADKFTVDSTNGNTVIQGTLSVTGTAIIKDSLTLEGGTSQSFIINTGPSGSNKFTVETSSGNTDVQGTLKVLGSLSVNSNKFIVTSTDGKTQIAGDLNVGSDVGYSKFTVSNATGDTSIAGFLKINSDKFIVTSATGKTEVYGDLRVGNSTSYNKFTVASDTGNTVIEGTLNVTGAVTFNGTQTISNSITLNGGTSTAATRRITGVRRMANVSEFIGSTYDNDAIAVGDVKLYGFKTGMIMMWTGSTSGNFDGTGLGTGNMTGWAICNGGNSTPDLRERFIRGVGPNYALAATGGTNTHTLTINEMPAHNHGSASTNSAEEEISSSSDTKGAHTHNVVTGISREGGDAWSSGESGKYVTSKGDSDEKGGHSHTSKFTLYRKGGGVAHENCPPYYALYYIMKT